MKKWVLVSLIVALVIGVGAGIYVAIQQNSLSAVLVEKHTPTPAPRVIEASRFGQPVTSAMEWPIRVYENAFLEIDAPSRVVRAAFDVGYGDLVNYDVQKSIVDAINEANQIVLRRFPRSVLLFGNSRFGLQSAGGLRTYSAAQGGFYSVEMVVADHSTGRVLQSTFMNFDLRTGEQFDLRAVFADNVDAELELNRWISLHLMEDSAVRNFQGVSMDTQFLIDGRAQALILKFDENTPALAGREVVIPFSALGNNGDVIAVFNRFPNLPHEAWNLVRVARGYREMDNAQAEQYKADFGTTVWFDLVPGSGAIQRGVESRLLEFQSAELQSSGLDVANEDGGQNSEEGLRE